MSADLEFEAITGFASREEWIEWCVADSSGRPEEAPPAHYDAGFWGDLRAAYAGLQGGRRWFAEGAIEGAPIVLLSGPEKAGKSWLAIHLAVAACAPVAGGSGAWLGKFPLAFSTGEGEWKGPIYLDSEYGEAEFARRVARLARAEGADVAATLAAIRHHYSSDLVLKKGDPALGRLLRAIGAQPPGVVILDPLRNALVGSENDADEITAAFRCLAAIRDAARAPVVILHHLNKGGSYAGNRALATRADLLIEGSDSESPLYSARGRSLRTADAIATPFHVRITHVDDANDLIAATRVQWEIPAASLEDRILQTLSSKGPQSANALSQGLRRAPQAVAAALKALDSSKKIRNSGGRWELRRS